MKSFSFIVFACLIITACSQNPEPIQFGKDGCHHCKMTLMDPKFGAEVVTAKGKVHKFDDINCMVNFINSQNLQREDLAHLLVIDLAQPRELIDARGAFFVKSENMNTPMGSGIVAFSTQADCEAFINEKGGNLMNWDEVVKSL